MRFSFIIRFFFTMFLMGQLSAFAQIGFILQTENCQQEQTQPEVTLVNQSGLELEEINLIKHDFATEFISNFIDDTTAVALPGLNSLWMNDVIPIPNAYAKRDSSQFFNLDSQCSYSIHLVNKDSFAGWFVGQQIVLPIYFEMDSDSVRPGSQVVMKDLYRRIKNFPTMKIEIGVHFDERCPKNLSTCLSCKQALSLKDYLVTLGLDPERIIAKGNQGDDPFFIHAKTQEEHRLNRRIVIKVLEI